MKTIPSFTVDHMKMERGIFISRVDTVGDYYVTTYDIRVKLPNRAPYIPPEVSHTLEHIIATYVRNDKVWGNKIVYFGPMGCLTGFYLLVKSYVVGSPETVAHLILDAFQYVVDFEGEIPGATPRQCGNYAFQDLNGAKVIAREYLDYMRENINNKDKIFKYPEGEVIDE